MQTLFQLVCGHAESTPDKLAVVLAGPRAKTMTYGELASKARALAGDLASFGSDRVGARLASSASTLSRGG